MKSHKVDQYIHYINLQRIREKGLERSCEKIIGENVLNLRKGMNLHIQAAKCMSLVLYLKSHCHTLSHFRFSMLFSKSFIVLPFIFRTVNHFKLIFVKGVSSVSRFIFLHVDVQLLQFCLLKGLSFLHSITFTPWSKITWLYLWGSISGLFTLLVYLSILL